MQVKEMKVADLVPYENNPRKNDDAVDAVAASIEEFGFRNPIIIDGENVIVAGHTRLKAAEKLGLETVPVIRIDDLTREQINALRLADNKTAELASWDFEKLDIELFDIQNIDMGLFGFNGEDWFDEHIRNDTSREYGNDEYNEFLDKFEPKKTTDDCYTPDVVYDAIAEWVENEYDLHREHFIRPFYPGGDYQKHKYPQGGWSSTIRRSQYCQK